VHSEVVKRWGGQMPFLEFFFFRLAATTAVLGMLGVAQGELVWRGATAWLILVLALTLSPVVTWLWSIPIFGGRPTPTELVGGVMIVAGVIVVSGTGGGLLGRSRLPASR
jgi:drug/metabolite transporter (DMT)-like permease